MTEARLLVSQDVPAAMELSAEAGWNQTEADWRRILALEPEGCFALDCEGMLAGTATAICYGRDMAWIGMVLTRSQFRRRGIARQLLERALAFTRDRDIAVARLDATPMGRPLYAELGFEDECAIERWRRNPASAEITSAVTAYRVMPALDRVAFGCDRTRLLESLATGECASVPEVGYAMGRPGARAAYVGPCIARNAEAARELIEWFLARHSNEPVFWDLLPSNPAAVALAVSLGFERDRALVRMIRADGRENAPPVIDAGLTFAIAGFEYG